MGKSKKAFTLIELIVVVVVLALLAAVAVPMISSWVEKAGESERAENARTIELLLKAFMAENSMEEFPTVENGALNVFGVWYEQYGSKIANGYEADGTTNIQVGENYGSRLFNPGTGHYIVNEHGVVFASKAEAPEYKGFIEYRHGYTPDP